MGKGTSEVERGGGSMNRGYSGQWDEVGRKWRGREVR